MVILHSYVSLPEGKSPFSYGFPMVFTTNQYGYPVLAYLQSPGGSVERHLGISSRSEAKNAGERGVGRPLKKDMAMDQYLFSYHF